MVARSFLMVGYDEKITWEDGQVHLLPAGRDSLDIFDTSVHPEAPERVTTICLPNSIYGPPTNLAVTPDQTLGLIADSMAWTEIDGKWVPSPGNDLYVIDLRAEPPVVSDQIKVGRQPSGLAINRQGTLALVTNRADSSVSVLSIADGKVAWVDEVKIGSPVIAVSFDPGGKRAFVAKLDAHRLGVLHIDGTTVTYDASEDIVTGLVPFNLAITPDGGLALTVDMGSPTASDGHADSISVVDLDAVPPRVIDKIMVEDGPEGITISPDGRFAAVAIVQGSNCPSDCWFHNPVGQIVLLAIEGKTVRRAGNLAVGALPEGMAFSPDSRYLYVGNFLDSDMSVLEVVDGTLVDSGTRIPLPGHPASMRALSC
jgi:DNA-binding beta-propeller fold protein YncE